MDENLKKGVNDNIIVETLPKEVGTRNRRIFDFARALKSLPQYDSANPQEFKELVRQWHTRALPKIRTKEFEETWIDFLKAWPRIKCKKGDEPIMDIFNDAIRLEPPKIALEKYPENKSLQLLTSLCRELQKASGEGPFFLSVRTAGRLLGVSAMHASRWLFLLVTDDILREVEKGGTAKTVRKATRFMYIADS